MKNFNWQIKPLTAKQKALVDHWRYCADPSQRLFSNYYTWLRWQVMNDYYGAMSEATEMEEKEQAEKELNEALQKLRTDYTNDIDLFFEIKFAMHNAFNPCKLKMQWVTDEPNNTTA